jgi:predicted nucleic-acid-binding Zn-ribbon protein
MNDLLRFLDRELNVPAGSMIRLGAGWQCAKCKGTTFRGTEVTCTGCGTARPERVRPCCQAPVLRGVNGAIFDADHYHEGDFAAVECSACGTRQVCS